MLHLLYSLLQTTFLLGLLSLTTLPTEVELLRANHPQTALFHLGYKRPSDISNLNTNLPHGPDVTVVLLNWSRLPNVILITSLMCSSELKDMVATILIWNNNPSYSISYQVSVSFGHPYVLPLIGLKTLRATKCPESRIRIENSKENLYFTARFLACASASTSYCFIQVCFFSYLFGYRSCASNTP